MLRGREDEWERSSSALAGRRLVVIHGAAGIGKSTLARSLATGSRTPRVVQALPAWSDRRFHPWLHAFGWPDPPADASRLAASVRQVVVAGELTLVEDLQWADAGTVEVLAELMGTLPLVCTIQTGGVAADELLERTAGWGAELVRLGALGPDAITELVAATSPWLLEGEVRRIVEGARGNPLMARVLAASTDHPEGVRPGDERAVLAALITRQSDGSRATLFALGAADAPLPVAALDDVEPLERAGLVVVSDTGEVALVHRAVAEPTVLRMEPGERRQVLERLASLDGTCPVRRSGFLLDAGEPRAAMEAALDAASGPLDRSEQADALRVAAVAATRLHRAGELDAEMLDPLLVDAARALNDSTRFDEADALLSGMEASPSAAALVELMRAAIGKGDRRRADELVAAVDPLIEAADGADGTMLRALRHLLVPWRAGEDLDAAAGLPEVDGGADRSRAAVVAGLKAYPADVGSTIDWFRVAREEAATRGALASELEATRKLVMVQIALGRHEEAQASAGLAMSKAVDVGERSWAIEFRTLDVLSRFHADVDHDEALSWMSYVRTAPVRVETRAIATNCLATMLADRGAVRRSAEVLAPWTSAGRLEHLEPMCQAVIAWAAVQRAWIIGDLPTAIEMARWASETVPPGYPSLAGMHVMWRWAEYESGQVLTAPDPGGALLDCAALEAEGIALLADGRHTAAARRFLDAASSWRPILVRSALRCRWAAGHALAVGGNATEAAALLEPLDSELDRSWCPALRPRLRASLRLAAARSRSVDPVERTGDGLSPRERSVMLGVAEGLTSVEIGRRLGITAATVNTHVHTAKRKLGARTRVEAAAMVGLGA